jgi:hypothetical protein
MSGGYEQKKDSHFCPDPGAPALSLRRITAALLHVVSQAATRVQKNGKK